MMSHLEERPVMSHIALSSGPVPAKLVPEMSRERSLGNPVTRVSMKAPGWRNCPRDSLH